MALTRVLRNSYTHLLLYSLLTFAFGLLLILLVLQMHRLPMADISIGDQRVVGDGQGSQVPWVGLSGDEGVRCSLQGVVRCRGTRERHERGGRICPANRQAGRLSGGTNEKEGSM